ncbi:MAG: hypothetical protein IH983_03515 [Planctomycetes bacterium]|nr:hypothetical protein [Planctomycetota bacterium]
MTIGHWAVVLETRLGTGRRVVAVAQNLGRAWRLVSSPVEDRPSAQPQLQEGETADKHSWMQMLRAANNVVRGLSCTS